MKCLNCEAFLGIFRKEDSQDEYLYVPTVSLFLVSHFDFWFPLQVIRGIRVEVHTSRQPADFMQKVPVGIMSTKHNPNRRAEWWNSQDRLVEMKTTACIHYTLPALCQAFRRYRTLPSFTSLLVRYSICTGLNLFRVFFWDLPGTGFPLVFHVNPCGLSS